MVERRGGLELGDVLRRRSAAIRWCSVAMNASWSCAPARSACQRSDSRTASSCAGGSSDVPKCVSASVCGSQAAIVASERSHASTSMSGGGVGASVSVDGGIRTPAMSPTNATPLSAVEVADVVGGVARRVLHVEAEHGLAAGQDLEVLLGDRDDLAPGLAQALLPAVQPRGARDELLGIGHVRRAAFVYVHVEVGPAAHERARGAGMVEVDMGEEQRFRPLAAKRLQQRVQARFRAGIHEDPVHLEAGDDLVQAAVLDVDLPHRPRRLRQNQLQ